MKTDRTAMFLMQMILFSLKEFRKPLESYHEYLNTSLATNQRGVGKGLMSQKDLDDIHKNE